jgi:ribosomal subunit interface protein
VIIRIARTHMNTNIKMTNIVMNDAISDYVSKRMKKIDELLMEDRSAQCDIELGKTSAHHQKGDIFRAEVHIVGAGKNLYASAEKKDLYAAIDAVKDEVLRLLKVGKNKRLSLMRRSGARVKDMVKGLWPWGRKVKV